MLVAVSRPRLPRLQKATALAVDECADGRACPPPARLALRTRMAGRSLSLRRGGRDVVPLSPAVREANRRNYVVPRVVRPRGLSAPSDST